MHLVHRVDGRSCIDRNRALDELLAQLLPLCLAGERIELRPDRRVRGAMRALSRGGSLMVVADMPVVLR
jgi:hypothetical protein